jgi:ABC-type multidrug transport system fused ATPase/permease subunit
MIDPSQRRIIHIYQLRTSFLFAWFTRTLLKGAKEKLQIEDLPHIPFEIESKNCVLEFLNSARLSTIKREDDDWLDKYTFNQSHDSKKGQVNIWPLLLSILFCHGWTFFKIMILKLAICVLSFVGPILLGKIVAYLEGGVTHSNLDHGFILVAALSGTTLLSSILNANANTRYLEIKLKLQASLAIIVYSRALSLPAIAWKDLEFSEAQINNFIQVDVDQISSFMQTINDLWVLPLQILVAFILLYAQIKVAFVAGILLMILMIPFNSYIANLIGKNTDRLMKEKDLRMKIMIESISNVISCKMFGLENIILNIANSYREKEFKYLSRRKYLDAICVFLWASTPVLVPFLTFVVAVTVTKQELKASNVITTIALLNMLIFPMNALPWIVNGFMEAKVSLKRIGKLLNSSNNDSLNIKQVLIDEINEGSEKKRPAFLMDDYPYKPENSKDPLIRPFNEEFNDGRKSSSKKRRASLPQERVLGDISFTIRKNSFSWISHPSSPESGSSKKLSFWSFSKKKPEHDSTNNLVGDLFSVRLKEDVFCRYGEMKAFVGSTGCGKTTLLLGILNEVRKTLQYSNEDYHHSFSFSSVTSQEAIQLQYAGDNPLMVGRAPSTSSMNEGHLALIQSSSKGKISYCAQVPAVFSGTIKSNIIMGNEFEIDRYQRILEGCCLIPDCNVRILLFPDFGDYFVLSLFSIF